MYRSIFVFGFFYLWSALLFAVSIKGDVAGFDGEFIRLYQIADQLSYREIKLDVFKIDQSGHFELNGHLSNTSLIKLKVNDVSLDLIADPDSELEINMSYDEEANSERFFDKQFTVEFLNNSDGGLHAYLFEYQKKYAAFLEENHSNLVSKKILPEVHKFEAEMLSYYNEAPRYFKTYLEYDLAALEDAVLGSEMKLFQNMIQRKPIRYSNTGYMNFFKQFYQERFIQISQGKNGFQLLSAVNGSQDYKKMMDIVLEHPFIENDTMAQLFSLLGLQEVYGDETFKKEKVLSMLNVLKLKALNPHNQKIANNMIEELTFLKKGKKAPDFNLQNAEGEVQHLSDYNEKHVLMFIWSANSNTCLREMDFISEYYDKYGNAIEVLAINTDNNPSKAVRFAEKKELKFPILFKDHQYDLIDKYRIGSVPLYVLIDKDGFIVQYPAKRPEENLEAEIFKLVSEN